MHGQVFRYGRFEQTLTAAKEYGNPLTDVEIAVEFSGPGNIKDVVNAFWDGGRSWKVRYQPQAPGTYQFRVRSSDASDKALNEQTGTFTASEYKGRNPRYQQGGPTLSQDRHYLVTPGGTPWFFMADTAWNGALLSTADEWKRYLADRAAKKFTAVQLVMTQWRAGRKDEKGQVAFSGAPMKINPAFFQRMDERLNAVNDAGLVAVPVLLWALTSKDNESPGVALGPGEAIQLARYMVARYGAHQVIWMLGGDGDYRAANQSRWKDIGKQVFPAGRKRAPVGLHPRGMNDPWPDYKDEPWLDIFFYQSGHGSDVAKWRWNAMQGMATGWRITPAHPVIDAEINYEGHLSYQGQKKISENEVRRAAYYSVLAGIPAGFTYGAHGIWFWARQPEVPLDHPRSGQADPWTVCLNYPGAKQMTILRSIFDSVPWWRLRPERELLQKDEFDSATFKDYIMPAVSDDRKTAVVYLPDNPDVKLDLKRFEGNGGTVEGTWADPRTGKRWSAGKWGKDQQVQIKTPGQGDWVLILQLK
jgi:hypothetical protein